MKCGTLSLEEVEASGIFSWQKYLAENNIENEVPFTLNFALLHTIEQDDYTGLGGDIFYGTMTDQATSVRGMMEAEYQGPPDGLVIPLPVNNHPEFISFDYYAFRQVHPDSALAHSGPAKMCDNDWLFLIEHFEEAIDSTVIPAWEDSVPVYFYPQTLSFSWAPDSTDIGVHRLSVTAATWPGESDSDDNSVDFVFLLKPRDYATEVRGDSWDMDDSTSSNAWNTDDIEAVAINWDTTSTGWTDSVSGMFEGVINYDPSTNLFKGDISFAIPEDSIEYIDTDKYHMLSFGITVNNPNRLDDNACGIRIRWKDTQDEWHGWQGLLSGSGYHVSNGWDGWTVIGPIDLKADTSLHWGDDDASELWFRIQGSGSVVKPPKPVDIRIGWVRLEESAQ